MTTHPAASATEWHVMEQASLPHAGAGGVIVGVGAMMALPSP